MGRPCGPGQNPASRLLTHPVSSGDPVLRATTRAGPQPRTPAPERGAKEGKPPSRDSNTFERRRGAWLGMAPDGSAKETRHTHTKRLHTHRSHSHGEDRRVVHHCALGHPCLDAFSCAAEGRRPHEGMAGDRGHERRGGPRQDRPHLGAVGAGSGCTAGVAVDPPRHRQTPRGTARRGQPLVGAGDHRRLRAASVACATLANVERAATTPTRRGPSVSTSRRSTGCWPT